MICGVPCVRLRRNTASGLRCRDFNRATRVAIPTLMLVEFKLVLDERRGAGSGSCPRTRSRPFARTRRPPWATVWQQREPSRLGGSGSRIGCYTVLRAHGIDRGQQSASYLAGWADAVIRAENDLKHSSSDGWVPTSRVDIAKSVLGAGDRSNQGDPRRLGSTWVRRKVRYRQC